MEQLSEHGDELPFDIAIGILSRLPVKSLFRFKSVCKNWDAILPRSQHLASMHLKNYTDSPTGGEASLLCSYLEKGSTYRIRSASLSPDGERPIKVDESLLESVICGTGNGLFLLGNPLVPLLDYRLWNPATREIRVLPRTPEALDNSPLLHRVEYCGVGLDLVANNDVKVVLIRNYTGPISILYPPQVFWYSLKSNCWRELPGSYPYQRAHLVHQDSFSCHTYDKGFFYWLYEHDKYGSYVVAFDMGNNLFHKINFPFDDPQTCKLSLYRDSVAVYTGRLNYSGVDVWLLGNVDGQWSWNKHSSLGDFPERLYVEGWWKDDQLIARTVSENRLVLFDTGSREVKVFMSDCFSTIRWFVYRQSLFWPSSPAASLLKGEDLQAEWAAANLRSLLL